MQEMQLRVGTIMVVALLVISLIVRFWEPDEAPSDENASVRVWKVDRAQIDKIELDRPEGKMIFAREGDDWRLVEPYQALADEAVVSDLAADLERVEFGYPVEGADAGKLGLGDPPVARAVVTLKDQGTRELVFGNKAVDKRKMYVRTSDGAVVAVTADISALALRPDEFRDRNVMRFKLPDVTSVTIVGPEGTLDVSKKDGRWWLGGFSRADDRKVEDLLLALLDLRYDQIADASVVPVVDGAFDVTVTLADKTKRVLHAEMPTAKDEPVVISAEGGLTGRVTGEVIAFLGQGPPDMGDPAAFPIDVTVATGIDVALGGSVLSLSRSGDAWQIDGKEDPRVDAVLQALSEGSVHYRAAAVPAATEKYGSIHATLGEGARTYDVFQLVDESFRVVQDEGGGGPYLVPADQVDAIVNALK